jgi:hypothetical protein
MTDHHFDDETQRRACRLVLATIRELDGWATKEDLIAEFGIGPSELDRCVDVLQAADNLQVADLGRITLLVASTKDVETAIAQLFDVHEREWRIEIATKRSDLEGDNRGA